jgi:predicted HTH domain antitoxin
VRLDLPDDILARAEANASDLRIILAVQLYADNRIEHADACELAGMTPVQMTTELLRRGITVQQYPPAKAGSVRRW